MAVVTFSGCAGCGACLLTCPTHAIRPAGGALYALPGRCTGCGECVEICPVDAVHLDNAQEDISVSERTERSEGHERTRKEYQHE